MMALALDTGVLVDDIRDAITFADRLGRAFGYASAAGDAFFGNLHGHGCYSAYRFVAALN